MRVPGRGLALLVILFATAVLFSPAPVDARTGPGLGWLARTRGPDGAWEEEGSVYGKTAVTGLATLAFLGAGETHSTGTHRQVVWEALQYLKQVQDPEGCFRPRDGETWLRDHAIAALAMNEAYGLTASKVYKDSAQRALDFLESRRETAWADLETTTWAVMALKSGKSAGLKAHPAHVKGVREFLHAQKARGNPRLIAMELLIRVLLGDDVRRDPWIHKASRMLVSADNLPARDEEAEGGPDELYWYFGTLGIDRVGGGARRAWNAALKPALSDLQHRPDTGDLVGSWDPRGEFGKSAGRTVVSSLALLSLECHYRYSRVFGNSEGSSGGSMGAGGGSGGGPAAPPGIDGGGASGPVAGKAPGGGKMAVGGGWGGNPVGPPPADREGYDEFDENPFRDPEAHPLSTFSIDVDTASYSNVRRLLRERRVPPKGAVRIEELLNYFTYDDAPPEGEVPFAVTTEVAECPWKRGHSLLRIGLKGRAIPDDQLPPANLVFLLDVSGSMRSWDKLDLVKASMRMLVDRLRRVDHVSIVVYAGASGVVLPPTAGSDKGRILDAIDRLQAGGSTNAGEGVQLAYRLARRNFAKGAINRVILATDGDFNVGITSRSGLTDLIEKEREGGVFLTVLGVGTGNLRDSQMEMLADKGNGNYAYLDSTDEAHKVLVEQAGGTLVTIAKDVKIQVEFNPNRVGSYRLLGYENRMLDAEDFADDKKDAGEIGAGHSVTALYEVTPPRQGDARKPPGLRYQTPRSPTGEAYGNELLTVKLRYKEPDGEESRLLTHPVEDLGNAGFSAASRDFRFSAAVAAFGMILRGSEHAGDADLGMVRQIAARARGQDPGGHRRKFLEVVQLAANLLD